MAKKKTGASPSVRLAMTEGGPMKGENLAKAMIDAPALLVSYFYLEGFMKSRHMYVFRDWVMDSGAYSAENSGSKIDLAEYMDKCKELMATDELLTEIFALDVIGDHKASAKNVDKMWDAGIPAIPCFHFGEPEKALLDMAKRFPKIALGGCARMRGDMKLKWAEQCFARIWPARIHGFGFGSESQILALPWHSVDATNWEIGPCKFGRWSHGQMSVRGSSQNLRSEVEHYMKIERRARSKWQTRMDELEAALSVRLAYNPLNERINTKALCGSTRLAYHPVSETVNQKALGNTVRLALARDHNVERISKSLK